MKKISKYLLMCIFAIAVSAMMFMCAFAEEIPSINVSSATGMAGETVDVIISLADNPGIISMLLSLEYDNTALKLTKVVDTDILGSTLHGNNIDKVPYKLCWANDTAYEDYTSNGVIVTLKFEILSSAAAGSYPITISYDYDNYDILNFNMDPVKFEVHNGQITVEAAPAPATYTVSYNANGGSGAPEAQIKTEGVALTLSSVQPVKDGYTFKGWATSVNGAVKYLPGAQYTENTDLALYAVWEMDEPHTTTTVSAPVYYVGLVNIPKDTVVLFAGYYKGRLVKVQCRTVTELKTEKFVMNETVDVVKTIVLQRLDNMVPVTAAEEIRISVGIQ